MTTTADICAVTRAGEAAEKQTATRAGETFKFDWESELELIAEKYSVPLSALRGKGKLRVLREARAECYRFLRDQRGWSLPKVGKYFNRDHSTIMHSLLSEEEREERLHHMRLHKRFARQWGDV